MKFAFLVHPRDISDISETIPIPIKLVFLLRKIILWAFSRLSGRVGFIVKDKFQIGENGNMTKGHIIIILLTAQQMVENPRRARERILEATIHAQEKLGCEIVGLGALTASVTETGKWLARQPEVRATITHGDHYAVALAIQGIEKITSLKEISLKDISIAIVGATGIIGGGLSEYFSGKVRELILIGRREKNCLRKMAEKDSSIIVTTEIEAVKKADIVVTATNSPTAIISSEHLKEGAIVYEVAQPRNVSEETAFGRPDILVIDGSYARVPDYIKFFWMTLPPQKTFGCMAETTISAIKGINGQHRVGSIDLSFVEVISKAGEEEGFGHAEFTSFNKPIQIKRGFP
jgi:fatty aldehyde-generating acyl-ACP reductase